MAAMNDARVSIQALAGALEDEFDADSCGFRWYASLEDEAVRGIRSNQLIGLVDAARAHLEACAHAAAQVVDLVGPNGRVMPRPEEVVELEILARIRVEIVDCLRAAGSLLDVLGGVSVLTLGLPVAPSFADSRQLLRQSPEPAHPTARQAVCLRRFVQTVAEARATGPDGWLEWTALSRNALVHRGLSIEMWLPVPTSIDRGRVVVVTRPPPMEVVRQFPHLRRFPDMTDAETVLAGYHLRDVLLHEPAQITLSRLVEHLAIFTGRAMAAFVELLPELGAFAWPADQWALNDRPQVARDADAFEGFDESAQLPSMTGIVMNPREGARLGMMEAIRRRACGAA